MTFRIIQIADGYVVATAIDYQAALALAALDPVKTAIHPDDLPAAESNGVTDRPQSPSSSSRPSGVS